MRNFWLVRLGKANAFAKQGREGGFIGVGFLPDINLNNQLADDWREFNHEMIPRWLSQNPTKSKVAAGLACGNLWTVAKGIQIGDVVLCPMGDRTYSVGEVTGDYQFLEGSELPHRRSVKWFMSLDRSAMSDGLSNTAGAIMTAFSLNKYQGELEALVKDQKTVISVNDETVEDVSAFALEKHLEDFLVQNWHHTELGKRYDIYSEEGATVGQQYPSDTGPIDILAISKDKKELLVVELKKGRLSDVVVGQIQRYMGYVKDELAEDGQVVRGVIIGFEDDIRIHRALSVAQNIEFYTYKIHFELKKK